MLDVKIFTGDRHYWTLLMLLCQRSSYYLVCGFKTLVNKLTFEFASGRFNLCHNPCPFIYYALLNISLIFAYKPLMNEAVYVERVLSTKIGNKILSISLIKLQKKLPRTYINWMRWMQSIDL